MQTPQKNLLVVVDGEAVDYVNMLRTPLYRAVIISLFVWRRARPDDYVDGDRMGWWADDFPGVNPAGTGSRLWLLQRETLTDQVVVRAKTYAEEALAWLIQDKVASRIDVFTERQPPSTLAMRIVIWRGDTKNEMRFDDVWSFMQ